MAQRNNIIALDNSEMVVIEKVANQHNYYWSKIGVSTNNEFKIMVRQSDNFINISKFIKLYAPDNRFKNWARNDNVKQFVAALKSQCSVYLSIFF